MITSKFSTKCLSGGKAASVEREQLCQPFTLYLIQQSLMVLLQPGHSKPYEMICAPSKDSAEISLHTHMVRSVFAVKMKKPWVLSYPQSARQRLVRLWVGRLI